MRVNRSYLEIPLSLEYSPLVWNAHSCSGNILLLTYTCSTHYSHYWRNMIYSTAGSTEITVHWGEKHLKIITTIKQRSVHSSVKPGSRAPHCGKSRMTNQSLLPYPVSYPSLSSSLVLLILTHPTSTSRTWGARLLFPFLFAFPNVSF